MTTRNITKCAKCQTIIESVHRRDFKSCKCKAIFVDGGTSCPRFGGNPEDFVQPTENEIKQFDKTKVLK